MQELTAEQRWMIAPVLPRRRDTGRVVKNRRAVVDAIFCWFRTGHWPARDNAPSVHTCRRYMRVLVESGALAQAVEALIVDLESRGEPDRIWADSWELRTVEILLRPHLARALEASPTSPSPPPALVARRFVVRAQYPGDVHGDATD